MGVSGDHHAVPVVPSAGLQCAHCRITAPGPLSHPVLPRQGLLQDTEKNSGNSTSLPIDFGVKVFCPVGI